MAEAGFFRFTFNHGFDEDEEPTAWPDYDGLIQIADGVSNGCLHLAEAIKDRWQHHEVDSGQAIYDYGDVVMFDSLVIKAASAAELRVVWRLLRAVVRRGSSAAAIARASSRSTPTRPAAGTITAR